MENLPLKNIKVLDLTTMLSGPFCTLHLAHMGAEIIKIEQLKTGDSGRVLGSDTDLTGMNMGSFFLGMNAGKKSLTLNLKTDEGKDIFKQLVRQCDVVVENFRAGVMDKLGLGFDSLKAINDKIIYCAISGYGQSGDMSTRPAYDQVVQGVSGLMSTTGEPPKDGDLPIPYRVGVPISDTIAGITAAFAVASAIHSPHQKGTYLDISMLESVIMSMGWVASEYTVSNKVAQQQGNHSGIAAPSGSFRTKDGMINIAATTQEQWENLATHVGHPEWIAMDKFKNTRNRINNRPELNGLIDNALSVKTTAEWIPELLHLRIPVGEILNLEQSLNLNQIKDRGFLQDFDVDGIADPVTLAKPAVMINNTNPDFATPPEPLSKSTDTLLKEMLNFNDAKLAQLHEDNII